MMKQKCLFYTMLMILFIFGLGITGCQSGIKAVSSDLPTVIDLERPVANTGHKVLALTFDTCGGSARSNGYDGNLIDYLEKCRYRPLCLFPANGLTPTRKFS